MSEIKILKVTENEAIIEAKDTIISIQIENEKIKVVFKGDVEVTEIKTK